MTSTDNQFFVVFNLWTMSFCTYVVAVLAFSLSRSGSLDGQVVGLIAVYVLP